MESKSAPMNRDALLLLLGLRGVSRTHDFLLRRETLYPSELHEDEVRDT